MKAEWAPKAQVFRQGQGQGQGQAGAWLKLRATTQAISKG